MTNGLSADVRMRAYRLMNRVKQVQDHAIATAPAFVERVWRQKGQRLDDPYFRLVLEGDGMWIQEENSRTRYRVAN